MAVSVESNRIEYTGNGATTAFAFTFKGQNTSDIKVYQNGTLKTETTHYTVSLSTEGGTVTFVTAPTSGHVVIIIRDTPNTQGTDFPVEGTFPEEHIENALDKLTMQISDLEEKVGRCVAFPVTSQSEVVDLPEPSTGKTLKWTSTGNLENSTSDPDESATAAAASASAAATSASAAATSASAASSSASSASSSATAAAASATTAASYAQWVKVNKTHTDFQTAATSNTIELFSLLTKEVIRGFVLEVATAFAGSGITSYRIAIGITGTLDKYVYEFDLMATAGTFDLFNVIGVESLSAATSIKITATANANLSNSTAGSMNAYVKKELLAS